ncbi:colicin E8 [Pseudomonas sp. LRP2-20]|uniref:colicin E3/pyocin S6 family cytotoxin n=1 Tax=Pseudomonas sp. LRP2-20 TaxID=2944234 RepID=UPI00218C5E82|nr:colicin E3/pyocin S6 family cytotoxin [Pseudomonas sp. LRP2-20]BDM22059.1 colicin E8 [Pseudomonas sp. LRP2-20]
MTKLPIPSPSYLDKQEYLGFIHGERRWRSLCKRRIYTWDAFHGEIEVFNSRGKHLEVLDAESGETIKDAVKGRKINV